MTHGWPAMLTKRTAMAYLDLSDTAFEREIAAGRLPPGVLFGGRPHWYRAALDNALAVIAGGDRQDHIARFEERRRGKKAA